MIKNVKCCSCHKDYDIEFSSGMSSQSGYSGTTDGSIPVYIKKITDRAYGLLSNMIHPWNCDSCHIEVYVCPNCVGVGEYLCINCSRDNKIGDILK